MKSTTKVFWGSRPTEQSEIDFLAQVRTDLDVIGRPATILANFYTHKSSRQIDFLVITESCACLVELKSYSGVLSGGKNGPWSCIDADGRAMTIDRDNPYAQALSTKMALSDDMAAFCVANPGCPKPIDGKFYKEFETVVSIFPEFAKESKVPNDYKVKVLGYQNLLQLLLSSGKRPRWHKALVSKFINYYGLVDADLPLTDVSIKDANTILDNYFDRFRAFHGQNLDPLIPTALQAREKTIPSSDAEQLLKDYQVVQFVGCSGAGKSHLGIHTSIKLGMEGWLILHVPAGAYDGRLSSQLERSCAPFSSLSLQQLLRIAEITNRQSLIVIDGVNECRPSWKSQLLLDVAAICHKHPVKVLLTTTELQVLPGGLKGIDCNLKDPDKEERRLILQLHGVTEFVDLYRPFETSFELSLAAKLTSQLGIQNSRSELFEAYVTDQLKKTSLPSIARSFLRKIAIEMDKRMSTSLPLSLAKRIGDQVANDEPVSLRTLDEVMTSRLLRIRGDVFMMQHELITRFLAAEWLIGQNLPPENLASEIRLPSRLDLAEFAVGLQIDFEQQSLLFKLLATPELVDAAVRHKLGSSAAEIARGHVTQTLNRLTHKVREATVRAIEPGIFEVVPKIELENAEAAALEAIGGLLGNAAIVQSVLELFVAAEELISNRLEVAPNLRVGVSRIVEALRYGTLRSNGIPVGHILEAIEKQKYRSYWEGEEVIDERHILELIRIITPKSVCLLFLLWQMLDCAIDENFARHYPQALNVAIASTAYHVILLALFVIHGHAGDIVGDLREELVSILESYEPENLALSASCIDALHVLGAVDSIAHIHDVRIEINNALSTENDADAAQLAYSIFANQFEDVLSAPYIAALDELGEDDRIRLLIHASMATGVTFHRGWLLDEVFQLDDPRTRPVFERWATELPAESYHVQDDSACFETAVRGFARFNDVPPSLRGDSSEAKSAWEMMGHIIFWLNRPGLDDDLRRQKCAAAWQRLKSSLLRASIEPLYELSRSTNRMFRIRINSYDMMLSFFPEEVRELLESYLNSSLEPVSYFAHAFGNIKDEFTRYVIKTLGEYGDHETIQCLMRYVDDKNLGPDAVAAIRRLNTSTSYIG